MGGSDLGGQRGDKVFSALGWRFAELWGGGGGGRGILHSFLPSFECIQGRGFLSFLLPKLCKEKRCHDLFRIIWIGVRSGAHGKLGQQNDISYMII